MKGYKTYVIAALLALAAGAKYLGWVDDAAYTAIVGVLAGGGFAALRHGIATKESKK